MPAGSRPGSGPARRRRRPRHEAEGIGVPPPGTQARTTRSTRAEVRSRPLLDVQALGSRRWLRPDSSRSRHCAASRTPDRSPRSRLSVNGGGNERGERRQRQVEIVTNSRSRRIQPLRARRRPPNARARACSTSPASPPTIAPLMRILGASIAKLAAIASAAPLSRHEIARQALRRDRAPTQALREIRPRHRPTLTRMRAALHYAIRRRVQSLRQGDLASWASRAGWRRPVIVRSVPQ